MPVFISLFFLQEQPHKSNQHANPLDVQRAALLALCLQPTAKAFKCKVAKIRQSQWSEPARSREHGH